MISLILASILNFSGPNIDQHEVSCLAETLYVEARGESLEGKIAVANVIINRVDHPDFPDSICTVVHSKGEFAPPSKIKAEKQTWKQIYTLSEFIVRYHRVIVDPTNGALFFHTRDSRPYWAKKSNILAKIDNHIFYK